MHYNIVLLAIINAPVLRNVYTDVYIRYTVLMANFPFHR